MTPPLLSLPSDILIAILILLRPEHLLVLGQTCRVLHEFTLDDYVWHRLVDKSDLPLDIEPYVDRNNLSAKALQAIVTNALRVEHNWRKLDSRINRVVRLEPDNIINVSQIQFIGSHWLGVLRRSTLAASLSVWRVAGTRAYRAAFLDIPAPSVPLKFSATMQRGCKEVLIALISSTTSGTVLSAYSIFLKSETDNGFALPSPRALYTIHRPESEGQFYEVHVCGHLIAVGIPKFVNSVLSPSAYRILFINYVTGVQCLVNPGLPERFLQLHFKLSPQHLVLAGVCNGSTLVLRSHELPAYLLDETAPRLAKNSVRALPTPNAEYEAQTTISDLDYNLSADSTHSLSHISVISFHSINVGKAHDYIFHFPLDSSLHGVDKGEGNKPSSFVNSFSTHVSASAEIVCLGETGHRAIWLERRWTSDEYTLMKATFSPNVRQPVAVQPLLARHAALPFELSTVVSLAFEEASGRVCLAVHTGELYMLEF
ncbi:hypothetical protein B0H11DRAFT_2003077 [Mycena galericulata]|nr:hypothetical protein B0H11DRAFT_2003077 [Mycena galericulata]